jgi:Domain of unknown function (DUF4249)
MKIKIKYIPLYIALLTIITNLIITSCQKVINVDLNNATPHIVIEGLITDKPGPYTVLISKSGSYFNQPALPPVSGAVVIISDNAGTIDTLDEMKPGNYFTSKTLGIPGHTYRLKVISENNEYTGSSTMHSHVRIDSLGLVRTLTQHLGLGGNIRSDINVSIHCFFKDPVEKNFYRIKVIRNDSIRGEDYRLFDDQYTNGLETDLRVAEAAAGDTDIIELSSLDNQTYEYYRTLEDLLNTNPIFGSTPANPNTNLDNGALGYFGAAAVASRRIRITKSMLNNLK